MGVTTHVLTLLQLAVVAYFGFNALNLKVFFPNNTLTNPISNQPIRFQVHQSDTVLKDKILDPTFELQQYNFTVNINDPLIVCINDACTSQTIKVNHTHYQQNFTFNVIQGDFDDQYAFQLHTSNVPYPFHNQFYHLYASMQPINNNQVVLTFQVYPITFYKFTLFLHYAASFNELKSILKEKDIDQFKTIFIDTNIYYLFLTLSVSILHSILDFFAFKNDVLFWREKRDTKDFKGLSLTSILVNIICQFVILLYLMDTGKTNSVIIASSAVQLIIEFWKCSKLLQFDSHGKMTVIQDKETLHYDKMAFKYMSIIILPILLSYAAYSLVYELDQSSGYSLFIKIMASFVYGFQFTILTPQLFINYHLKSVSHLPMRMLTYKFLGTIVDDLFAFIIEMPTMHRLACFRDDVVFVIYIYQAYIYPVDKSRVNEYGQSFEDNSATTTTTPTMTTASAIKDTTKMRQRNVMKNK